MFGSPVVIGVGPLVVAVARAVRRLRGVGRSG